MRRLRPLSPASFVLVAVLVVAMVLLDGSSGGFDTVNWGLVVVFPLVTIGIDLAAARGNRRSQGSVDPR